MEGNVRLYELVPFDEMTIHKDKYGNEKNTGTTVSVWGNTNQVEFKRVFFNGKEYCVKTKFLR